MIMRKIGDSDIFMQHPLRNVSGPRYPQSTPIRASDIRISLSCYPDMTLHNTYSVSLQIRNTKLYQDLSVRI